MPIADQANVKRLSVEEAFFAILFGVISNLLYDTLKEMYRRKGKSTQTKSRNQQRKSDSLSSYLRMFVGVYADSKLRNEVVERNFELLATMNEDIRLRRFARVFKRSAKRAHQISISSSH